MADMYDKLGLRCGRTDGMFGVEIEVEGRNLPRRGYSANFDRYWKVEKDGSLRGEENAEYVFSKPLSLEDTSNALGVLEEAYTTLNSRVDESIRAGVHTHLNVQRLSPLELLTFSTTYYMLENFFVHWAGKERVGNHFCLRATDAEDVIYKIIKTCQTKDWRHLNTDDIRYASLNWNALHKYGSLEFRAMRSTRNLDDVYTWVVFINQLLKGSKKFKTPRDVVASVSEFNASNRFVEYVMEEYAFEFLKFDLDIWEAMENVQPVAFMIDWNKFNKEKINPFL